MSAPRSGSPTSTLAGPEAGGVQEYLVTSYTDASVLAHTPACSPPGVGVTRVHLDLDTGSLKCGPSTELGPNPAFVCPHPSLAGTHYLSTERIDANGEVLHCTTDPATGLLTVVSRADAVRGRALGRALPKGCAQLPLGLQSSQTPCATRPLTHALCTTLRAASPPATCTSTRRCATWWCVLPVVPGALAVTDNLPAVRVLPLQAVSYWDAVITVLPLSPDGSLGSAPLHRVQHPAASSFFAQAQPTREIHWKYRQQWPHAHCVVPEPYEGEFLFSTDLGLDVCHVWRLDAGCGALEAVQTVQLRPGRGPRHVAFHPRVPACFVVNELDSTVTVLAFHRSPQGEEDGQHQAAPSRPADEPVSMHSKAAVLQHVQTLSSLPESAQGKSVISPQGIWKAASHSSELRLRPDGRFLCVGNRGHDSIAVFAVDETAGGMLTLAHVVPAGGACPRHFNFSRCGAFLLVGCQNSNALTAFAVDPVTGALTPKASLELPSPNYVHAL